MRASGVTSWRLLLLPLLQLLSGRPPRSLAMGTLPDASQEGLVREVLV